MGSRRGCSSHNSPDAIDGWEPGSAIRLGIRSALCSRDLRNGDARNARVSSAAEGRIRRKAQPAVSRSSPAGSRKVNSNSLSREGIPESWREKSGVPFTDLASPRHPWQRNALPVLNWEPRLSGRAKRSSAAGTIRWPPARIQRPERPRGQCLDRRRRRQVAQTLKRRPQESRQPEKCAAVSCGSRATPESDGSFGRRPNELGSGTELKQPSKNG